MGKVNTNINPYNAVNVNATHIGGINYPSNHPSHNKSGDIYLNTNNSDGKVYVKVNGENKSMQDFFESASRTKTMLSDALAEFGVVTSGNETGNELSTKLNTLLDSSMKSGTTIPLFCTGSYTKNILKNTVLITTNAVNTDGNSPYSGIRRLSPKIKTDSGRNIEIFDDSVIMMPVENDMAYYTAHIRSHPESGKVSIECGFRKATVFDDTKINVMIVEMEESSSYNYSTAFCSIYNENIDKVIGIYMSTNSSTNNHIRLIYMNPRTNFKEIIEITDSGIGIGTEIALHAYDRKSTKLIFYTTSGDRGFKVSVYDLERKEFDFKLWDVGDFLYRKESAFVSWIGYDKYTNTFQVVDIGKYKMYIFNTDRSYVRTIVIGGGYRTFKNLGDGTFIVATGSKVKRMAISDDRASFPKFQIASILDSTTSLLNNTIPRPYRLDMINAKLPKESDLIEFSNFYLGDVDFYSQGAISYMPGYPPSIVFSSSPSSGGSEDDYYIRHIHRYANSYSSNMSVLDKVYPTPLYRIVFTDYDKNTNSFCDTLYVPSFPPIFAKSNNNAIPCVRGLSAYTYSDRRHVDSSLRWYGSYYFAGNGRTKNEFSHPVVFSVDNYLYGYTPTFIFVNYNALIIGDDVNKYNYVTEAIDPPPPVILPYVPGS